MDFKAIAKSFMDAHDLAYNILELICRRISYAY